MAAQKRRRLLVDHRIQGALVLRAAGYWLFCLLTITLVMLCWRMVSGPVRPFATHLDDLWFDYAPALVASLLMLPVIAADSIRLTNRFAGPVYRLRRSMRQLAAGESVTPIAFRDGDFWSDFADDFNDLCAKHEELRRRVEEAEAELAEQRALV